MYTLRRTLVTTLAVCIVFIVFNLIYFSKSDFKLFKNNQENENNNSTNIIIDWTRANFYTNLSVHTDDDDSTYAYDFSDDTSVSSEAEEKNCSDIPLELGKLYFYRAKCGYCFNGKFMQIST